MSGGPESKRLSLGSLLAALPVVVAWIYFVGRVYLESYYLAFGADFSFLRPDLNDALLFGAMGQAGVALGFVLLVAGLVVILLAATFATYFVTALFRRNWALAKLLIKNILSPRRWGEVGADQQPPRRISKPTFTFEAIFGAIGALVVSVMMANQIGNQAAVSKLRDWAARDSAEMNLIRFAEGESTKSVHGQLIGCGDAACAFWTKTRVLQLPRESIVSLRSSPPRSSDR
jgi:hypothetical protein